MNPLEHAIRTTGKIRPSTRLQYLRQISIFLAYAGHRPLTGALVEQWRDALRHRGLATSSVNLAVSAIKTASFRCFKLGLGPDFAAGAELLPKDETKTRAAPTIEAVEKIVEACEGRNPQDVRDRAMVLLMARTGLRIGGVLSIRFDRIKKSEIWVQLKGKDALFKIVLGSEEAGALYAWLGWLRKINPDIDGFVFRSVRMDVGTGYKIGGRLGDSGAWRAIKRRGAAAGYPGFHCHLLRHFFVSYQRSLGTPDWRIAQITGHKILSGGQVPMLGAYTTDLNSDTDPIGEKIPPLRRKP